MYNIKADFLGLKFMCCKSDNMQVTRFFFGGDKIAQKIGNGTPYV